MKKTSRTPSPQALPVPTDSKDPTISASDAKAADINIKLYESARAELIQRIILRDGALLFYIAAIGAYFKTIFDAHFGKPASQVDLAYAAGIMVPLPIVCLVFTLIVVGHHLVVGRIGAFLRAEINWGPVASKISKHWDNSDALLKNANFLITLRLYAQGLMLCIPLLYDIGFYFRFRTPTSLMTGWNLILGVQLIINLSFAGLIAWIHFYAHSKRKKDW